MVTSDGGADTIKNAICIHEEDAGTGWKHTGLQILRSTNNPPRIVHRKCIIVLSIELQIRKRDCFSLLFRLEKRCCPCESFAQTGNIVFLH